MSKQYDMIIIGAGIVGSMTARFLSQYQLDILLIEKEADIALLGLLRRFSQWQYTTGKFPSCVYPPAGLRW